MNYISMNPVFEKIYIKNLDSIKNNLRKKGFYIVPAGGQLEQVKNKFNESFLKAEYDVIEMLYCLGGCNNGQGA